MSFKTLYKTEWLELREKDGYIYSHDVKSGGHGVAVLVFHPTKNIIVGRFEMTPCHTDEYKLCALTGQVVDGNPWKTAVMELEEEAGIVAMESDLIDLGFVWPSKSSDMVMHLYALPWEKDIEKNPKGDGSVGEVGAMAGWIPINVGILSGDALISVMLARLVLLRHASAAEAVGSA